MKGGLITLYFQGKSLKSQGLYLPIYPVLILPLLQKWWHNERLPPPLTSTAHLLSFPHIFLLTWPTFRRGAVHVNVNANPAPLVVSVSMHVPSKVSHINSPLYPWGERKKEKRKRKKELILHPLLYLCLPKQTVCSYCTIAQPASFSEKSWLGFTGT